MADTKYGDKMWQEQYERWTQMKPPIEFTREEDARPLIKKLGLHITDRKFVKEIKTTDAEYYGMDPWVTDEMAEVALKMTIHKPYTIPELEKMNKRPWAPQIRFATCILVLQIVVFIISLFSLSFMTLFKISGFEPVIKRDRLFFTIMSCCKGHIFFFSGHFFS